MKYKIIGLIQGIKNLLTPKNKLLTGGISRFFSPAKVPAIN